MKSWENDFRYDWVSVTLHSLNSGFEVIRNKEDQQPWFDGIWQMEYAENIFGLAFVAAQAYILGSVEDVNKIRESAGKERIEKNKYYSDDPQSLPNGISRISLINSAANYYKHHDEWDKWPTNGTTKILKDAGILETTEFPLYEVATRLLHKGEYENMENLLAIISEWREHILSKYI